MAFESPGLWYAPGRLFGLKYRELRGPQRGIPSSMKAVQVGAVIIYIRTPDGNHGSALLGDT